MQGNISVDNIIFKMSQVWFLTVIFRYHNHCKCIKRSKRYMFFSITEGKIHICLITKFLFTYSLIKVFASNSIMNSFNLKVIETEISKLYNYDLVSFLTSSIKSKAHNGSYTSVNSDFMGALKIRFVSTMKK